MLTEIARTVQFALSMFGIAMLFAAMQRGFPPSVKHTVVYVLLASIAGGLLHYFLVRPRSRRSEVSAAK